MTMTKDCADLCHPHPCLRPMWWWGWVRETPLKRPWRTGEKLQEWGNYVLLTDGRLTVTLELAFPFPTSITLPHCLHWVFRSLICPASGYLKIIPDSFKASWGFWKTDGNGKESCKATKILRGSTYSIWYLFKCKWCQKCFWASPFHRSSLLSFQEDPGTFSSQVWPQQIASPTWEFQSFLSSSI